MKFGAELFVMFLSRFIILHIITLDDLSEWLMSDTSSWDRISAAKNQMDIWLLETKLLLVLWRCSEDVSRLRPLVGNP